MNIPSKIKTSKIRKIIAQPIVTAHNVTEADQVINLAASSASSDTLLKIYNHLYLYLYTQSTDLAGMFNELASMSQITLKIYPKGLPRR